MPHDITAIRAHLKRFMTNIRDVLTTEEDFIRYETLCARLQNLDNLTKMHYTAHPVLTREYLHTLIPAFVEAALAADEVLSEEETGPVGLQLKTVVRELMPYLMSDLNGLNLLNQNPTLPEKPLSELISQVRTQTADMEDAYAVSINRPVLIRLNSPTTNEIGLFTPSRPGDANEHKTAFSRMAAVLGGPDLVVKTRPLMLTHGGASTAGVFVSQTEGLDPLKVRPGDPLLAFKKKNLDTGAAISGLAGMQLMDFLASGKTLSRGPEDCYLRFNPDSGAGARLIGLSIKPDTIRFSGEPFDPAALSGLSVIPAGLYEQLQDPAFETQLRLSLQDVPLPEGTIEQILARRSALVEKVERDRTVYQDAAPGFVQPGKLRVVPDDEWDAYHLGELAVVTPGSPFDRLLQLPAASIDRAIASEESFPLRAYPAIITGNGLYQEKNPLNTQREGTLKLQIPMLNGQTALKGAVSSRYPIQFRQNGELVRGMFTLQSVVDMKAELKAEIQKFIDDPALEKYKDVFQAIQTYYTASTIPGPLLKLPSTAAEIKYGEMGLSRERVEALVADREFAKALKLLQSRDTLIRRKAEMEERLGSARGQRADLRNAAMSDIADELGVPALLARSVPAQAELDGKVVDGIFMEEAKGQDLRKAVPGSPMAMISADQSDEVFNTKGLKSLADMQILDYICLNQDRHQYNMFYQFEGLETGHPKFIGVQGIDNDYSFGTRVPKEKEYIGHLPALSDIRVISESMARSLSQPGLFEKIAAKMKADGLREAEVDAARQRLLAIKRRLEKGKMTVVRDEEWGKGRFTWRELGKGSEDSSIFQIFKHSVVETLASKDQKYKENPQPVPKDETIEFQDVLKVESLGGEAMASSEAEKREHAASEEFIRKAEENLSANITVRNPEHAALFRIHEDAAQMLQYVKENALPWPWGSKQYRDMQSACENLLRCTGKVRDRLLKDPAADITYPESKELKKLLTDVADKSTLYTAYKKEDLKHHDPGSSTEQRQKNAVYCAEKTAALLEDYAKERRARLEPMHLVYEKLEYEQAKLSGKTGKRLREQTARVLYLAGLTRMDFARKTGVGVLKALHAATIYEQTGAIMEDAAFKRLTAMPDNELRLLASRKDEQALADKYIQRLAQVKLSDEVKQKIADEKRLKEKQSEQAEAQGLKDKQAAGNPIPGLMGQAYGQILP